MNNRDKVCWLAKKLSHKNSEITEENIDLILGTESVMLFLCVWTLFESAFSEKHYLHTKDLEILSESYKDISDSNEINFLSHYFHRRYHEHHDRLMKLAHKDEYECVSKNIRHIMEQEYNSLCKKDKIYLLFYVVFRYRNNLFHGNKDIIQWECFEEQINYCIQFMIKMIDEKESEK